MDQPNPSFLEHSRKPGSSHTSSIIENNSMLNTEEEKKSELSDHEACEVKIDRYEYYSKYDNIKPLQEGKVCGYHFQISYRYKIQQFST